MEGLNDVRVALNKPPVVPSKPKKRSQLSQIFWDWPSLKSSNLLRISLDSIPGNYMPKITD